MARAELRSGAHSGPRTLPCGGTTGRGLQEAPLTWRCSCEPCCALCELPAQLPWLIQPQRRGVQGGWARSGLRPSACLGTGSERGTSQPGPLPTADRRGGTDGQPAAPPLRPHREAAAQEATRLQHSLPVQGPRPAANVRGECVQALHPVPHGLLPPGPGSSGLSL